MSFDYAAIADDAAQLVMEFGAAATLTRTTPTYDESTGIAGTSDAVQSVYACVMPYGDKMVNGTTILASDQQAYIAARGVTAPQPGDTFTWQSVKYNVISAKNIGPAGIFVFYELQVRG